MAKAFIASAIDLNADLQESLTCVIHRGLLSSPMILPCKGKHRLCEECTRELIGSAQNITCPQCRESYAVPCDWKLEWFDRILHNITSKLSSNESEINQKVIRFVQESYSRYGSSEQRLHIKSVQLVSNSRLKAEFNQCKRTLNCNEIVTLLHGTTRKAALSISGQGFRIPLSFDRDNAHPSEGELKLGKAIYFAEAKKATEYGEHTLVLADCILGQVAEGMASELKLTPDIVHQRGHHTIQYNNEGNGLVDREWAIYDPKQCYPLCIIDYEFLDVNSSSEDLLIDRITKMSHMRSEWNILHQALIGTENQCKEALRFVGDAAKKYAPEASRSMYLLLTTLTKEQIGSLLKHSNETIRILFLRALWQTGRRDHNLQLHIYQFCDWSLLMESLQSGYVDVSWRACGVMANMAAVLIIVRHLLVSHEVLNQLILLLKRAVQHADKLCVVTVLHLLANVAASEYAIMKQQKSILDYVNGNLLDHNDVEIREAGNRLFCNIIGKGTLSDDWQRGGYKVTEMAPTIE